MELNRYLDHSVLIPNLTKEEAREGIQIGLDYNVRSVCVRPCDIDLAVSMCRGTDTAVCCVLDFPHGTGGALAKEALAKIYIEQGVEEIDMVMDYSAARSGRWDVVEEGIRRVVQAAHPKNVIVKVIFETSELSREQIEKATEVSISAGADFIKSSTGFAGNVTEDAVRWMMDAAAGKIRVKVSGGIPNYQMAKKFIEMGASRLGVKYSVTPVWMSEHSR